MSSLHKREVVKIIEENTNIEPKKPETVTINKATLWQIISGVLGLLFVISLFTGGFGIKKSNPTGAAIANPPNLPTAPSAPSVPTNVDMKSLQDDDAFKGEKNAPVVIVEFSDYQCPFCQRFYQQTLGQIEQQYIKSGKVKLVYRDFPLDFHPNAQKAAEAAECAGEQNKYWEMHNKLFESGVEGGVATFKVYAKDLGLDTGKFDTCLDSGKTASEVKKDMQDGSAAGISGTPGFIINGQLISGAQPFSVFQQVIEANLN